MLPRCNEDLILPALGTAARCQSLAFRPFCEGSLAEESVLA